MYVHVVMTIIHVHYKYELEGNCNNCSKISKAVLSSPAKNHGFKILLAISRLHFILLISGMFGGERH